MSSYAAFLESKAPRGLKRGMKNVPRLSAWMHPLQRHCVQFALECGSSGEFLDTGLGKTGVQLEFAEHARHEENGKALILTPLAVAKQFEREGKKWGYDAFVIRDQSEAREGINICNYDRLHLLDPNEFGVITLDEAALIKNFSGKVSRALINAFANHRWRMPATAAPTCSATVRRPSSPPTTASPASGYAPESWTRRWPAMTRGATTSPGRSSATRWSPT